MTTLIITCFLLASLAFMDSAKAQENTNTWTVTVTDRNNNPISGIMVFLYETETGQISDGPGDGVTDANGILVFSEMTPPNDGGYTLVEIYQLGAPSGSWSSSWVEVKNANLQGGQPMVVHAYFDSALVSAPYSGGFPPYTPLTPIATPTPSPYYFPTPTGLTGLFSTNNLLVVGIVIAFALGVWMLKVAFSKERKKPKKQRN